MKANNNRYNSMKYNRCGNSGIKLPAISLGLWQNFGGVDSYDNAKELIFTAFDLGITHFDLANNYGPPPGSAESTFGRILKDHLIQYRDEMIISSKAGYDMWPGPYGEWGSRKYLISSLDQSLKRLNLEYVDIFYSHRFDPDTPLEETMGALDQIVRSGKALYAGISNYRPEQTQQALQILNDLGTPCLIHQPRYSMYDRWIEDGLTDILQKENIGSIVFSPLARGLLTDKYLKDIPSNSRAGKEHGLLQKDQITQAYVNKTVLLNEIAKTRNQSLAQMALAWVLHNPVVTSALIGASSTKQIEENVKTLENLTFSDEELLKIENILTS